MKKMISLALCLTMALAFAAGCKKKEEAPAAPATEAPAAAPAAPVQGQATSKQAPAAAPAEKAPEAPAKH